MNYSIKVLEFIEYKAILIASVVLGAIMLVLSRDLVLGLRLYFTFLCIFIIPGYALAKIILPDWDVIERTILGVFLGIGIFGTLAYILGFIGIPAVNLGFGSILMLSGLLIMHVRKK